MYDNDWNPQVDLQFYLINLGLKIEHIVSDKRSKYEFTDSLQRIPLKKKLLIELLKN